METLLFSTYLLKWDNNKVKFANITCHFIVVLSLLLLFLLMSQNLCIHFSTLHKAKGILRYEFIFIITKTCLYNFDPL